MPVCYPVGQMAHLFDHGGTNVGTLLGSLAMNKDKVVLWERGQERDAGTLLQRTAFWANELKARDISAGTVCAIAADFELASIALMLALMEAGAIVMPISYGAESEWSKLVEIAGAKWLVRFSNDAAPAFGDAGHSPSGCPGSAGPAENQRIASGGP